MSPIPIPLIIPRELENNINDNKTVVTSFIFPAIDIVNADVFLLEINEVILTINAIIPLHNNSMLDLESRREYTFLNSPVERETDRVMMKAKKELYNNKSRVPKDFCSL